MHEQERGAVCQRTAPLKTGRSHLEEAELKIMTLVFADLLSLYQQTKS